jgi:hypothetical protein
MAVPTSELQMSSTTFVKCLDGKHCRIKCPPNAGSLYFNYKSFRSMKLLGVADANCCFTLIDVGALGRENNSSDFSNTSFGRAFGSLCLVT